jgi:hypothetical protein
LNRAADGKHQQELCHTRICLKVSRLLHVVLMTFKTNILRGLLHSFFAALFFVSVQGQERNYDRTKSTAVEPIIAAAAARYKLDPYLLWTIAYLESRFRPEAISYKDGKPCARGLMQLTPATAKRYGAKDPHNLFESIEAAARYVRDLRVRFGNRADLILAAYNAGEGTVEAFRDGKTLVLPSGKIINPNAVRTDGIPPYRETREYVTEARIVYKQISGEPLFSFESPLLNRGANSRPSSFQQSIYSLGELSDKHEVTAPAKPRSSLYPNQ